MNKLRETEIIKAALFTDLTHQKKTIRILTEQGKDVSAFREWRDDTEDLYLKFCKKYFDLKVEEEERLANTKRIGAQKKFTFLSHDAEECTLHYIDFNNTDARKEQVGSVNITIKGNDKFRRVDIPIHGNGCTDEEYKQDFANCFVCLPHVDDKGRGAEPLTVYLDDFVDGLVTEDELGIKFDYWGEGS